MDRLAKKLKALRKQHGLSQEGAAKKAGVSSRYYSRLETNRHDPKLSTLVKLAKAFGVDVKELL